METASALDSGGRARKARMAERLLLGLGQPLDGGEERPQVYSRRRRTRFARRPRHLGGIAYSEAGCRCVGDRGVRLLARHTLLKIGPCDI